MKRKEGIILITVLIIIFSIIFILFAQTNGFFVRFQNEFDLKTFLEVNLEINVSSLEDVAEFMQGHTSRLEDCSIITSSDYPNLNYDDNSLYCKVLSNNTSWVFSPIINYYTIRFYFDNGILQQITVGRSQELL